MRDVACGTTRKGSVSLCQQAGVFVVAESIVTDMCVLLCMRDKNRVKVLQVPRFCHLQFVILLRCLGALSRHTALVLILLDSTSPWLLLQVRDVPADVFC